MSSTIIRAFVVIGFAGSMSLACAAPSPTVASEEPEQQDESTTSSAKKESGPKKDSSPSSEEEKAEKTPTPETRPEPKEKDPAPGAECTFEADATGGAGQCGGRGGGSFDGVFVTQSGTAVKLSIGSPACAVLLSGQTHSYSFAVKAGDCTAVSVAGSAQMTVTIDRPGEARFQHVGADTFSLPPMRQAGTVKVTLTTASPKETYGVLVR